MDCITNLLVPICPLFYTENRPCDDSSGDEDVSQQSPQQYSSSSQGGYTISEDFDQLVNCATKAAPFAATAGPLGIVVGGVGCGLYAWSDWDKTIT